MTTQETINLLFSFLGGGIVVAIIDWIRAVFSEKKSRKIRLLNDQIQKLYGPLHFFASQNACCIELHEKISLAYDDEFIKSIPRHLNNIDNNITKAINLANSYIQLIIDNNERIVSVLQSNYYLIDTDDVDIFLQIIQDYTRMKVETDNTGRTKAPSEINKHIGKISLMQPDLILRMNNKFNEKKTLLESLSTPKTFTKLLALLRRLHFVQ